MVHPTNLVILFQGDHLLISYRARDTFALCTIADVSSLVNISRKNVQCWWPTFSLQETQARLVGVMYRQYPADHYYFPQSLDCAHTKTALRRSFQHNERLFPTDGACVQSRADPLILLSGPGSVDRNILHRRTFLCSLLRVRGHEKRLQYRSCSPLPY